MRSLNRALVPLAAVSLLGGCSDSGYALDPEKPSRVVELDFEEEHTESYTAPPCLVMLQGMCLLNTTYYEDVPDTWTMKTEQCDDGQFARKDDDTQNCKSITREISEVDYSRLAVGDVITMEDEIITKIPR